MPTQKPSNQVIQDALQSGALCAAQCDQPLLHTFIEEGDIILLKEALELGANPNIKDKDGDSALHFAIYRGNPQAVSLLIKHGADIDKTNPLQNDQTLLTEAVYMDDIDMVTSLIRAGAKINDTNNIQETPLHIAAWGKNLKIPGILIKAGGNIHAKDKNDNTPFHDAAHQGHTAMIDDLVLNGAEIETRNNAGETPLHCAVKRGRTAAFNILLGYGADTSVIDKDRNTILHSASMAFGLEIEILEHILKNKLVDPLAENQNGETAYDVFRRSIMDPSGFEDIENIFKKYDAAVPGKRKDKGPRVNVIGTKLINDHGV